ncbi:MAG TPA: septation protein SepH [Candidatus Lumbricidophila sp.]|nr:septation protein SepH [Candidatus Lumbricidophila sp.]
MDELTIVRVEDGTLIAASSDGTQYRLKVDDALRSGIRQATAIRAAEAKLSPREVQAHIRRGLSAADVAELTGAALEYVQRFEGPVIAERDHIVSAALSASLHNDDTDAASTFGSLVRDRLTALDVADERWASWKDDERGWLVKLEFVAGGVDHDARWEFNPKSGVLTPVNSEASALMQFESNRATLIPRLRAVEPSEGRFDSAAFEVFDVEALTPTKPVETSSPAVAVAAIKRADVSVATSGETADLLDALRRRRGERSTDAQPSANEPAMFDLDDELDAAPAAPALAQELPSAVGAARAPSPMGRVKKGNRTAMPSWDEIVFGARTDDDLA